MAKQNVSLQWVIRNKEFLNIKKIEIECGLYHNALWNHVNKGAALREDYVPLVEKWVKGFVRMKK